MSGKKENKKDPERMWSASIPASRIEALIDATLAIIMTILVLELSMDEEIINAIARTGEYNMNHLYLGIFTFIMGFITLGIYWALHHYIFFHVKRSDGVLVWLNIVFLISAAMVPLGTKVNQTHIESYAGFVFFSITTVVTLLLILVMWIYATKGHRLVDPDLDRRSITVVNNIILIGTTVYVLIVAITYFIPVVGYLGFIPMGYVISSIIIGDDRPWRKVKSRKSS